MANLNLLPIPIKIKIAKDTRHIGWVNNVISLTIVLALVSILLISTQKYLDYKTRQVKQVSMAETEELSVEKINNTMLQADVIQKDYVKWSRLLQNFLALVPTGNKLHSLQFDKSNQKLTITGFAATREAFLKLEEKLKNSDLIINVNSPISNLLYKKDINFNLDAELNL